MKGKRFMKLRYLVLLAVALLLVVGCRPLSESPTSPEDVAMTEESPTDVETDTSAPEVAEPAAPSEPSVPAGGVEVALAAIEPVDGVLATVNGQEITWADYEPELTQSLHNVTLQYQVDWNQAENIEMLAGFQDQVLQTVIDRTVLRQAAVEEGLDADSEAIAAKVEEQNSAVMASGRFESWEDFLTQYGLTKAYFERLMEDAVLIDLLTEAHGPNREVEQVYARHILVSDEETGQTVLDRLADGEAWETLASEFSEDTSNKDDGGDLGWFPRGAMVAPFEEAAFSMEPGTTSELVETDFGFHIIQVLEKGLRAMDEPVYQSLAAQAFQTWLNETKESAEITVEVTFGAEE
jgi:parvulin-like peptidyl-prolyl isomerase